MVPGMEDTGRRDRGGRRWGQMARGQGRNLSANSSAAPARCLPEPRPKSSPPMLGAGLWQWGLHCPLPSWGTNPGLLPSSSRRARNNWGWDMEVLQRSLTLQQ